MPRQSRRQKKLQSITFYRAQTYATIQSQSKIIIRKPIQVTVKDAAATQAISGAKNAQENG